MVKTWGSSPRPVGSLLCCNSSGLLAGSLSGGCVEDDLLDKLRQGLQQKLEQELGRAEARWGQDRFETLRLAAQKLADQLTAVEELEERLRRQLEPDQGH